MKTLAALTGTGWKGYTAGLALMLYAVVLGVDAAGIDVLPDVTATVQEVVTTFLEGLAVFGIRAKLDQ